jgi:cysteine desulfurase
VPSAWPRRSSAPRSAALPRSSSSRRCASASCAGLERISGARALGAGARTAPWIVAVELEGPPAEVHMHHLESRGVWVSAGSACQTAKGELSPTLDRARSGTGRSAARVLRFSFGRTTTASEIDAALEALAAVERELTTLRGGRVAR